MRDVVPARISAWVDLDGASVDIVSLEARFVMDDVPAAKIVVALGLDTERGGFSDDTEWRQAVAKRSPASLWVTVAGRKYRVFRGYVAGIKPALATGRAGLEVEITHWLHDMAVNSAETSVFAPGTGHDLVRPASFIRQGGDPALAPEGVFPPEIFDGDVPEGVIEGARAVAESGKLTDDGTRLAVATGLGPGVAPNEAALGALELVEGFEEAVLASGINQKRAMGAIRRLAGRVLIGGSGETLLARLIGLARMLDLHLLPGVEDAVLAPCTPYLRADDVDIELPASEYMSATGMDYREYPLRGVVLHGQGTGRWDSGGPDLPSALGVYLVDAPGTVLPVRPPSWLQDALPTVSAIRKALKSEGCDDYAISEDNGEADDGDDDDDDWQNAAGNKLAQAYFLEAVLAGRYENVSGHLRFDIRPGCLVKLGLVGSRFSEPSAMCGRVREVLIRIETESPSASTSFRIEALRPETDNEIAVSSHPLYASTFVSRTLATENGDA